MSTVINWYTVKCEGEAHSNPFIDNCITCTPLWGRVLIPVEFSSLEEYREAYRKMSDQEKKKYNSSKKKYIKILNAIDL